MRCNPHNRLIDGSPSRDVACGDGVCVASVATGLTPEIILSGSVASGDVSTLRAGLTGVGRLNQHDGCANQLSLVGDKVSQLAEGPRVVEQTLCPANGCLSDTLEVFKGNGLRVPLGFLYNLLGNRVVERFGKVLLFARAILQVALRAWSTTALKALAQASVTFADLGQRLAAVNLPLRVSGDIDDAKINAKSPGCGPDGWLFHVDRDKEKPLALEIDKVSLAKLELQQFPLSLSAREGDFLASLQGGQGRHALVSKQTEVPGVKGNRAKGLKQALLVPFNLVGVSDLGNHADGKLGRKPKLGANIGVDQLVQLELAKHLSIPGNLGNIVSRLVGGCQRLLEGLSLLLVWPQLKLYTQTHISSIEQREVQVKGLRPCWVAANSSSPLNGAGLLGRFL